jgi:epoxyqueuosine reductase
VIGRAGFAGVLWTAATPIRKILDLVVPLLRPFAHRSVGAIGENTATAWWVPYFRLVPSLPRPLRFRTNAPLGAWPAVSLQVPEALRSYPGYISDPAAEDAAFEEKPLRDFLDYEYPEIGVWVREGIWRSGFFVKPRLQRVLPNVLKLSRVEPQPPSVEPEPETLTREIKELALGLGLSAVGIAEYDVKYRFKEFFDKEDGHHRVIVCILEENYAAQQTAPSIRSDRATLGTYADIMKREIDIAACLHRHGYRAFLHDVDGQAQVIPYAVAAGLGQLGLNGQLLTPVSGSRCRIMLISTNAPLIVDHPIDYGIPKVCDNCRACVRRCPAKALSAKRDFYRGVWKSKLNTARCLPVLRNNHDCDICTTVCPVQRYGLPAIFEEFERTGTILGKRTDDLEGYDFDGEHYGPERRPSLGREYFDLPVVSGIPRPRPDSGGS